MSTVCGMFVLRKARLGPTSPGPLGDAFLWRAQVCDAAPMEAIDGRGSTWRMTFSSS
jgi:hypothetical protein